jgi:class 3 adenylate cyclase/predicted ATPase/tetratricopeptide (TPR) repeat protein
MLAPTGWVTLVFTDIQGSTLLWERLGDAFHNALEVHDRAMRDAIAAHSGYEVKTEGDAFMVSFASVSDAVEFCLDAQDRLHNADWPEYVLGDSVFRGLRVRMGVHVGDPLCKRDPNTGRMDYYGRMVNRAARIGAAGHGGQIVVSAAAYAEMGPVDAQISDLGWHALRGFEGRERLWQVTPRRLAQHIFPALRTVDVRRTNLPTQVSAFVGRGAEFQRIEGLLADGARLITLVGPGGAGKTRLALRAAGELLAEFPGGVWLCDLADAANVDAVCAGVAAGLGIHLSGADPVGRIGEVLAASERVLLLLDETDRATRVVADTVQRWLRVEPGACFMVTSRVGLVVPGERIVQIGPLPTPNPGAPFQARCDSPAIALFTTRARAANPSFTLTEESLEDVSALVTTLGGLPLAIELAATRVNQLPPSVLRARLESRIAESRALAMSDGAGTALDATIAWAWEQLRPWERAALAQLSVFSAGFSPEAAEAVLDLTAHPSAPPVQDILRDLGDNAMIRQAEGGRFALYTAVHYWIDAQPLVPALGRDEAVQRHILWYARLGADGFLESLERSGEPIRWRAFVAERENLLAATRRAADAGCLELAARCAIAALFVFDVRGPASRGAGAVAYVRRAVAEAPEGAPGIPVVLEPRLLHRLARLERQTGRLDAAEDLSWRARVLAQTAEDQRMEGIIVAHLAALAQERRRLDEALAYDLEALALHRAIGNRRNEGVTLGHLGIIHQAQGRHDEARSAYEASIRLLEHCGDQRFYAISVAALGSLHAEQGRTTEARRVLEEALSIHRKLGNERQEAATLLALGAVMAESGDVAEATERMEAAIPLHRAVSGPAGAGTVHARLGRMRLDAGDLVGARRHLDAALGLLPEGRIAHERASACSALAEVDVREGSLDAAEAHLDAAEPALETSGTPAQRADQLRRRGMLAAARGDAGAARSYAEHAAKLTALVPTSARVRLVASIGELRAAVDGAHAE